MRPIHVVQIIFTRTAGLLDVLAVNVMKEGLRKYRIYLTPLPYNKEASRKEQMEQLSAAYVAEWLETLKWD